MLGDGLRDQFLTIGLVQNDPAFGIARNNVHNVPDPMPIAGQLWYPGPLHGTRSITKVANSFRDLTVPAAGLAFLTWQRPIFRPKGGHQCWAFSSAGCFT